MKPTVGDTTRLDPRGNAFNATEFRSAIRFAMQMGLPSDTSERITFRWRDETTHDDSDSGGKPWNFSSTPVTTVTTDDVQVTCGVSFMADSTVEGTPVGPFQHPRIVVSLLEDEYDDVATADEIVMDGATYDIKYWEPPQALFDVTVYKVHAEAVDEA